jgi:hypothetical protein
VRIIDTAGGFTWDYFEDVIEENTEQTKSTKKFGTFNNSVYYRSLSGYMRLL